MGKFDLDDIRGLYLFFPPSASLVVFFSFLGVFGCFFFWGWVWGGGVGFGGCFWFVVLVFVVGFFVVSSPFFKAICLLLVDQAMASWDLVNFSFDEHPVPSVSFPLLARFQSVVCTTWSAFFTMIPAWSHCLFR